MIPSALTALLILGQGAGKSVEPNGMRPSAFELVIEEGRVAAAQATNAPIVSLAKRLSEDLKIPVKVAPELAKSKVTFRPLKDVTLTELLLQMTSSPLVDTQESWGGSPKLISIRLGGELSKPSEDEPKPAGMLIEGNTDEELVAEGEEAPAPQANSAKPSPSPKPEKEPKGAFLRVWREEGGRISLRARGQGLGGVLFQIAQTFGVRFDMRVSEGPTVSELSIVAALPSELPGILGPGVGLVVRRNIATGEERPLRFFLDPADSTN